MRHHHTIAIYVQDLDPSNGGIERVTYVLSTELASRGYSIYAIYIDNLPANASLYSHYKGLHQGNANRSNDIPGIIRFVKDCHTEIFLNQCSVCHSSVELQKAIKEKTSATLIDAFHTTPSLLDSLKTFSRPLPIPGWLNRMLFRIHKAVILRPIYRKGNRLSYELCNAFVMLSPHYFAPFAKDNKIKDVSKLYAITNPYETTYNAPVRKEKIILVVARLNNQQKRIDRTLRFWKKFHTVGDGWKLMVVGEGDDKEKLIRMSEELGLTDCSFEGHSDSPMDYYNRAMIFMMTSDVEGFGMTLVEAMSAGCVPVAMDCFAALPDIVTDKQNGMIIPKDDIPGMVAATEYILANFSQMSANARKSVKRFTVETVADKWEKLFNKL